MRIRYFPGLNGLRFLAAFLVLISHAYQTAVKVGFIGEVRSTVIFDRGAAAVDFFFTLSGFLITYLLLQERAATGAISLSHFYLRRICRIWPLYFLILLTGFVLFAIVYPRVFHVTSFEFPAIRGLLLYIFFLPNVMFAFYKVGLLSPLWSIGVEEQFYLFWAPFVRIFRDHVFRTVLAFTIVVGLFQIVIGSGVLNRDEDMFKFLHTLRFHYMGVGALFACVLFSDPGRLLNSWITAWWFQALMLAVLLYHYTIGLPGRNPGVVDLPLAFLYAALIVNVSLGPRRWMNLEWEPLIYLGKISYGIYMFHMALEYCLREAFQRAGWIGPSVALSVAYGAILLGLAILAATLSYQYVERRFLALAARAQGQGAPVRP